MQGCDGELADTAGACQAGGFPGGFVLAWGDGMEVWWCGSERKRKRGAVVGLVRAACALGVMGIGSGRRGLGG